VCVLQERGEQNVFAAPATDGCHYFSLLCEESSFVFSPNSFASLGHSKLNLEKTKKSQPTQHQKKATAGAGESNKQEDQRMFCYNQATGNTEKQKQKQITTKKENKRNKKQTTKKQSASQ
jgi:hypothetical protein